MCYCVCVHSSYTNLLRHVIHVRCTLHTTVLKHKQRWRKDYRWLWLTPEVFTGYLSRYTNHKSYYVKANKRWLKKSKRNDRNHTYTHKTSEASTYTTPSCTGVEYQHDQPNGAKLKISRYITFLITRCYFNHPYPCHYRPVAPTTNVNIYIYIYIAEGFKSSWNK
jgi:hypothetical protein